MPNFSSLTGVSAAIAAVRALARSRGARPLFDRRPAARRMALPGMCLPVLAALSLPPAPAHASTQLVSIGFSSVEKSPQQIGADAFRRKLLDTAAAGLAVDERGGLSLGGEAAILSATRAGALDVAVLSGSVASGVVPELGVFDIPFLFRDADHARAVADGPVGAEIAKKFADKGLVLLALGEQGFRNMTNSKRPIQSPRDFQGLKIRVIPNAVYQMTFKALGADVVPMDFPLVYSALKDGRIDGQENPTSTIVGSHFEEVQAYLSQTRHFFAFIVFVANRQAFEALDAAGQAAVMAAAQAGADKTWRAGADVDAMNLVRLRAAGMKIIDAVDRQPFIDAVKPLEPEFERRFGKALLATIRSTP